MKILLDENLPHDIRHFIPGHDVYTVAYMQWAGTTNGTLLAMAAADKFDVLISIDAGMAYEQNTESLPIAVVLLHSQDNTLQGLLQLVPDLLNVLDNLQPRTLVRIGR